jgi:hypothetical protein
MAATGQYFKKARKYNKIVLAVINNPAIRLRRKQGFSFSVSGSSIFGLPGMMNFPIPKAYIDTTTEKNLEQN